MLGRTFDIQLKASVWAPSIGFGYREKTIIEHSEFPVVFPTSHQSYHLGALPSAMKTGETTVWVSGGASFRRIGDRV